MTAAYDTFMRQHNLTGSEKADGYSQDALVGLSPDEKQEVFRLLVTELPWSAQWLFAVDPRQALVVAKELEEKLRGQSYQHVHWLQFELWKYTGDLVYQQHMIEDYWHYDEDLRPQVISSIGRTPINDGVSKFLKQVIMAEVNVDAVARAGRALLHAAGYRRVTAMEKKDYRRLIDALQCFDPEQKRIALMEIDKHPVG